MTTEALTKIKYITPAFDKRDADPAKNYGIGSEREIYVVVGEMGAVSFSIRTDRFLPHVSKELNDSDGEYIANHYPRGGSVDYHYRQCPAEWKEWAKPKPKCPYLNGDDCYCDGSALAGELVLEIYIHHSDEGVWQELANKYEQAKAEYILAEQENQK